MTSLRANLKALPAPVWVLFGGTFVNRFGTFVMPFLVIYLTRSGFTPAQAGLAVSTYGGGHLVASMLGGHLADRIGRRHTIALSMFSSSAAMVALSIARGYFVILLVTFFAGMAAELYRPAAGALIGDLVAPEQRVAAFGMYRFAINLGFAIGPATAGFLADRSFTWIFIGDAITSALYGVVALFFLPHGVRSATHDEKPGEGLRVALADRTFVRFLLATLCVTWVEFQIHSTLPLYMSDLGLSTSTYGSLLAINGVMIVLFELAITSWTQRMPPQPLIAIGYALSAFGFAMTGFARTVPALALTVVVWTIGEMIYAPVTGAFVTNLAPERYRGRYHGLWVLMWSLGMLLGPSLGTLVYQHDARMLWAACAAMGVAGAALALTRPRSLAA
jgi:MFS family permease